MNRRQFQAITTSNLFPGMGDGHASLEADGTYTYHDGRIDGIGPFYLKRSEDPGNDTAQPRIGGRRD